MRLLRCMWPPCRETCSRPFFGANYKDNSRHGTSAVLRPSNRRKAVAHAMAQDPVKSLGLRAWESSTQTSSALSKPSRSFFFLGLGAWTHCPCCAPANFSKLAERARQQDDLASVPKHVPPARNLSLPCYVLAAAAANPKPT